MTLQNLGQVVTSHISKIPEGEIQQGSYFYILVFCSTHLLVAFAKSCNVKTVKNSTATKCKKLIIDTFPCSRQSTQHERKREIVRSHTGSGILLSAMLFTIQERAAVYNKRSCKRRLCLSGQTPKNAKPLSHAKKKEKKKGGRHISHYMHSDRGRLQFSN